MRTARRTLLMLAATAAVGGCGFQLRKAPDFALRSLRLPASSTPLMQELRLNLAGAGIRIVTDAADPNPVDAVLDILIDQREKVVVGLSTAGQVREFQLRVRLKFRLRNLQGQELIGDTELLQQRDISFSETAALAKEAEEILLYRSMQTDLVQQVMRRLAAVRPG